MYWVIRACPTSPSFCSFSSEGTTTCSSCRMIDAVMYGMIPSAKIASWLSAPPENRLRKPKMPEPLSVGLLLIAAALTPGT